MVIIIIFFVTHWFLSLFFHSFFLHRYASHKMYNTSKNWERVFYFTTWLVQGSSFLVPRAYGVMHRMHHTYSDTEKDPHSPHFFEDIWHMMAHTASIFRSFVTGKNKPDAQFMEEYLPAWTKLDKIGNSTITRILFGAVYTSVYIFFAPSGVVVFVITCTFFNGSCSGCCR